jgi:hypothetical protein
MWGTDDPSTRRAWHVCMGIGALESVALDKEGRKIAPPPPFDGKSHPYIPGILNRYFSLDVSHAPRASLCLLPPMCLHTSPCLIPVPVPLPFHTHRQTHTQAKTYTHNSVNSSEHIPTPPGSRQITWMSVIPEGPLIGPAAEAARMSDTAMANATPGGGAKKSR